MSATVRSTYTVWCDHPGCPKRLQSNFSRAVARRTAQREGWQVNVNKTSRTTGDDFCPDHKPEPAPSCSACGATKNLTAIGSGTLVCEDSSACLERAENDR